MYISGIRDGRHWKGSEMFEILRFEKRQKTLVNTCHPGFLDLLSYLWNLRLHYPNLTFWRSYGHIVIDSVISIPSMFFYLWGCWKSHNPLIPRLFCVERRFGIWECHIWSPLWTCFVYSILVPLNEKFGLAMWSLKPDGLFSYEYWTKLGMTKVALRGHGVAITAKPIGAYPKMIPKTMP